jgi:hypothetical protein
VTLLAVAAFASSASASATPLIATFSGSGPFFNGTGNGGSFTAVTTSITPVSATVFDTTAIVTFADGSTLDFDTVITIGRLDPRNGLYQLKQTDTVVGGTGQYAGATGIGFNIGETTADFSYFYGHGVTLLDHPS